MAAKRTEGALAALAVASTLLLSACAGGFQPLYATSTGVAPQLAAVDLVTPNTRAGFLLREQLNDELARDFATPPRYRLTLTVAETRLPRGVRENNVAAEIELDVRVGYRLVDIATNRPLAEGTAPGTVFFSGTQAPYAGIQAQQDAQERAVSEAATQIRLALSRYFAGAAPVERP